MNIVNEKTKKLPAKRKWLFLLLGIVLCIASIAVIAWIFYQSDTRKGLEVGRLLRSYNEQPELAMYLTLNADIGVEHLDTDAHIVRTELTGKSISCLKTHGITICYYDGKVFLENGKAYTVSEVLTDYSGLLGMTAVLYDTVDIEESEINEEKVYGITVKQERARELLKLLIPTMAEQLAEIPEIVIEVSAKEEELSAIKFQVLSDSQNAGQQQISVNAKFMIQEPEDTEEYIPAKVRESIIHGTYEVAGEFSQDILRLFSGWIDLENKEAWSANLVIGAECGPFHIKDTLQMFRVLENKTKIHCIRKNESTLYFTDSAVCDQHGYGITNAEENLIKAGQIPALIYLMCLNGNFECSELYGEYSYTFVLDEEGMKSIAYGIIPELEAMDITYHDGSMQIVVRGKSVKKMQLECAGSVAILGVDTPVSLEGEITFEEVDKQDLTIPQAVKDTLIQE